MAEIMMKFDTVTKDMTVTIDGKAVENVRGLNAYKRGYDSEGDDFSVCVQTDSENDENGIRTYTQICASETKAAKELENAKDSPFAGFVEAKIVDTSKLTNNIHAFFGM